MRDHDVRLPNLRRRIGMVFQDFELFPHLSMLGTLMVAQGKVLKRSAAEAEYKADGSALPIVAGPRTRPDA